MDQVETYKTMAILYHVSSQPLIKHASFEMKIGTICTQSAIKVTQMYEYFFASVRGLQSISASTPSINDNLDSSLTKQLGKFPMFVVTTRLRTKNSIQLQIAVQAVV